MYINNRNNYNNKYQNNNNINNNTNIVQIIILKGEPYEINDSIYLRYRQTCSKYFAYLKSFGT